MQYVCRKNLSNGQQKGFTQKGFTLVELVIVVAVIGIIASIAIPNYKDTVQRARRSEARSALLDAAHWLERVATSTGKYPSALPTNLTTTNGEYYTVSISSTDTTFTLTATRAGAQADDKCGNFTLTNAGERGLSEADLTVTECWNK